MAFALNFREQLTGAIRDQFEQLVAWLNGWTRIEHNEDGTHSDVTAESLTLQGGRVGEVTSLPYDSARFDTGDSAVWTVASSSFDYLLYSRVGQIVTLWFSLSDTEITSSSAGQLLIKIPELYRLKFANGKPVGMATMGHCEWRDSVDNAGIATVFPLASSQGMILELDRRDPSSMLFEDWPIATYSEIAGWAIFPLEPNNTPTV